MFLCCAVACVPVYMAGMRQCKLQPGNRNPPGCVTVRRKRCKRRRKKGQINSEYREPVLTRPIIFVGAGFYIIGHLSEEDITMGNCMSPGSNGGVAGPGSEDGYLKISGSPLKPSELKSRMQFASNNMVVKNRPCSYSAVCFRGWYPKTPTKANQDDFGILMPAEIGNNDMALFGVFDGHGATGDKCANFAKAHILDELKAVLKTGSQGDALKDRISKAFVKVNSDLHKLEAIDDSLSGTTAVVSIIVGDNLWVANVGDSRAVMFKEDSPGNFSPRPLSHDQTPYRRDERKRVREAGARVLSVDMLDGFEEPHDDWECKLGEEIDEVGDPPRIWYPKEPYPGTAFTRSIGDHVAEQIGVYAKPEIDKFDLQSTDRVLIVASDGVWEFLTNSKAWEIAARATDPMDAAQQLWRAAFREWTSKEERTDDITVIVIDISNYYANKGGGSSNVVDQKLSAGSKDGSRRGSLTTPAPKSEKSKTGASRRGSTKMEMGKQLAENNVADEGPPEDGE